MTVPQNVIVTGPQTTSGPGVYLVMTPGVTVTLETWMHWPDIGRSITIKDATGSITPYITVAAPAVIGGAIDGSQSYTMTNQGESITFRPQANGFTWSMT